MFKVLEVHSGYVSSALTLIVHILAAFYFLYILKTSYGDSLPGSTEKKVVWYKAPATTTEIPVTTSYQQPEQATPPLTAPKETESAFQDVALSEAAEPVVVNPLRMGRSSQERKSAWTKKTVSPDGPQKLTAATLMDAISHEQAVHRQAQAVYTKQEAVKQGIAAQMREITEGRLRHKIFSAAQMAFDMYKENYISPSSIDSSITLSLVINQKGEIIAVEILRSTGTKSLDEHIAKIFQTIKRIAIPASRNGQEFFTHTFTGGVKIHAGSGHIIFDYKDASGIHIV